MDEIFKVSKNIVRAKALREMAEDRLLDIKKEEKTYKIVEQYYEVMKELMTAIMYSDGFKTLSHKVLIGYFKDNYSKFFSSFEFDLMDETRRLRNDIMYYGKNVDNSFLVNKEAQLKIIIKKLFGVFDKH